MLDYADVLYPDAQIVHIVRDPRDVIDAWRRFYGVKSVPRATRAWVRYVRSAHQFAVNHPGDRVIELRYEDLVRPPEPTLRNLFTWLGEPWEESVLNFADRPHRFGSRPLRLEDEQWDRRNDVVRTTSIGVGHRAYAVPSFAFIRRTGGDLLKVFGYA